MNQKLSWGLFLAGIFTSLGLMAHDISAHSSWQDVTSPKSVGELLGDIAAGGVMVTGALGIRFGGNGAAKPGG